MSMIKNPHALTVTCEKESKTKQKIGVEHDINKLVKRYKQTGKLPILGSNGVFVDLSNFEGFAEMNNKLVRANEIFENYPSEIRTVFGNSIERFTEVMTNLENPENFKIAEALGFVEKKPVKEEPKATAIEPKKEGDK